MMEHISSNVLSSQKRINITEGMKTDTFEKAPLNSSRADAQDLLPKQNITKEKVEEVTESLNKFLQPTHTSLKFELHEKLNEYYVKVVDDSTSEVIREIPSKKLLDFYAAMTDFVGIMVDKKI